MEDEELIQDRVNKQTFLRKEIIESGYDPHGFKKYVESLKDDGIQYNKSKYN